MTSTTLSAKKLLVAGIALSAALGLGACSSNDAAASSSSSSSSTTHSRPEPIASLAAIPAGGSTAVALDSNFVAALGTLGLTPGTVGNATLADGSVSFPITGGTVTVFDKSSGYRPYVQGTILHQNSGLSLTAGGTPLPLPHLPLHPGAPARLLGGRAVDGQQAAARRPPVDPPG